ncbi:hypothetical protein RhiirA4_427075 [Rhizophagus irregularis]|uniref:Uncharacterized protein n=1 Tax=Rhizophagus irregularis TaxID=588596 RepID=A0A2I1H7L8_9GLOM|nr:hypothetical protein RhiirA4_427075 [Rhizophagus irregularis]
MKKLDKYKIFEGRVLGQYAYEKPGKLPGCCIFKRGTERSLETYYTAVFLINGAVTERYKRTIVELENRIRESEVDVTVKGRMKLEKEGEIKILTGKIIKHFHRSFKKRVWKVRCVKLIEVERRLGITNKKKMISSRQESINTSLVNYESSLAKKSEVLRASMARCKHNITQYH